MDVQEVIRRCRLVAACTEEPGYITRTFLSPAMEDAHRLVRGWMDAAGMRVWMDAAGNLRGVYGDGPRLMIGSHLDSVPRAGAYDGVLGVILAIALVERRPPCSVEVVAFSEEEGVRFGVPFIGSRAMVGNPVMEEPVLQAIRDFGLDPGQLAGAIISADVRGYLEFHIEQGPVLDAAALPLAAVNAIVGQSRERVRFLGKAGHAGATPMNMRRDALAGAAEWIGLVEREAAVIPELVATVGKIDVSPGAANVIAGEVSATLDVRHACDDVRLRALGCMQEAARQVAAHRGLTLESEPLLNEAAVALDCVPVERAIAAAGHPVYRLVSGAGHDAMILARRVPASMLFLRSPGGISHHPGETVLVEDVEAALAVGARFLEAWRAE